MSHHRRPVLAVVLLAAASLPAYSQVLETPTLYRLERTSTFTRGCFPPCMCPVMASAPITGTFRLSLITVGDVFDFYDVSGIRFRVRYHSGYIDHVTGEGTYAVSSPADLQRMEVTLEVGNEQPTVYHSDYEPGGSNFPKIALPISINGGYCHDTVIELRARPARRLYVDTSQVRWDRDPANATSSDVVYGDLRTLRVTGGAFDAATWACVTDGNSSSVAAFENAPAPGEGFWFLERETGDLYEDGDAAQFGSPDAGIGLAAGACADP